MNLFLLKWTIPFCYFYTLFFSKVVRACSTCFGDPNSQMAQGVNWAVGVMLAVVVVVLGLFTALILYLRKRSKEVNGPQKDF